MTRVFYARRRRLSLMLVLVFGALYAAGPVTAAEAGPYLFTKIGDPGRPAIVLAHDWFGDSNYYRSFAERLAGKGFSVFAIDMYGGKPGAKTHAEAWALMKEMSPTEADAILDAGIAEAAKVSDTVITIGFSLGAPFALRAAARNGNLVDGAIIFYGDPVFDPKVLSGLGSPVLAIFGSADATYGETRAADVAANFSKAADDAGKRAEIYIFPGAAHAFAQPLFNAGKTFDPIAAEAAWTVALDFIHRLEKP